MRKTRHAAPALRLRDVVPAAASVVLLLGVAGCMGALGGGPLDGSPGATAPTERSTGAQASPSSTPSIVLREPDEPTPGYLEDFVDRLAESKRAGNAPDAFLARKQLFSCGEFVLDQGETMPAAGWDCLAEHVEDGAELVEVVPTTEGDPIISYFRVGPEIDGIEIFFDSSFDKFGSGEWEHQVCELDLSSGSAVIGACPAADVD